MESASVPVNECQKIIGHQQDFTKKTWNPDGFTLLYNSRPIQAIDYLSFELSGR